MTERTKSHKFYILHPLQNACACQISQSRLQVVNSDPVLQRFSTRKENNSSDSYKSCVEGDSSSSTEWQTWILKQNHVTNTAHRAPCDTLQQLSCRAHRMKRQHSKLLFSKSTFSGSPSTFKLYPEIDCNPLSSTSPISL